MKKIVLAAIAALAWTGAPSAKAATVIDNITGANAGFYCLGVAGGCGQTFGQSFQVTGPDTRLDSFTFKYGPVSGGSVDVVFRLFQWDGFDRVGSELFSSAATTLSGSIWDTETWNVNTNLVSGLSYIAYLDTSGLGNTASQNTGFSVASVGGYAGGTFQWERTANDNSWNINNRDSEFRAEFSSVSVVPLPAALPLLAGGLSVLGFAGWRRKRSRA